MTSDTLVATPWANPALQDRSSRTEQRILEATEKLMALRQFHEISVSEIAREAKASVSSLYARFPSKESLLGAVYARHAAAQQRLFDEVLAPDRWADASLSEIIRGAFPQIVSGYRARQGLVRAFLEQASKDVRFRKTWDEVGDRLAASVAAIVMPRVHEISHPKPVQAMQLGLDMVFATLAYKIQMHQFDDPEMDQLAEELIQMQLRYLGASET